MSDAAARGTLIVFEGAEGVGKSTQLRLLGAWLDELGARWRAVREPGGSVVGDEIRRLLLDPSSEIVPRAEALLFMASRAQLIDTVIRPAIDSGEIVIADRLFLSTYAYQSGGRGLDVRDVQRANSFAVDGLVPDLTILLELPVAEGLARARERGAPDRMESTATAFHDRVAAAFRAFADSAWQASHPECGPIVTVDASGSEREVADRIATTLQVRWPETFQASLESHQ